MTVKTRINPDHRSMQPKSRHRHGRIIIASAAFTALAATGLAHAATGAGSSVESTGFVGMFFASRSAGPDGVLRIEWFGTILIWILLLLSVTGFGLALNLATLNSRQTILPRSQVDKVRSLLKRGSWKEAMVLSRDDDSDFGLMIQAALREAPQGFAAMVARTEQVAIETATDRFRRIEPLNVLGQVAPMIGLFGTVYGMIVAFQSIVASGGNADPVALAGGIGTALVTTFWGLLVAIPALAGYAFIRNRVDALNSEAESTTVELLERFKPSGGSDAGEERTE
ncbi:MAG: MotA/TolQ/ExbB proton channel family protein [Phycisphaerales bacterium]|nr:MotA/TolQ/ExbB proton channel family protein [Phycisphaerales bacterium]